MIPSPFCRMGDRAETLALAATMLSAILLVGCGGGGGGGNGGGGGGRTVTGRVVAANAARTPVQGATVTLRDSSGAVVATQTTLANGTFTFTNAPANAVLFRVDPPTPAFHQQIAQFRGNLYGYTNTATAGGACIPDIVAGGGAVPSGTTTLPDIQVYESTFPPPPPFGCPR